METMNKLAANIHCIVSAEERFGGSEANAQDLAMVGEEPQRNLSAAVHLGDGS